MLKKKNNWQKYKIISSKAHQETAFNQLNGMVVRKRKGKVITLIDGKELIEFVSCSYLGLDQDLRLLEAISKNLDAGGINFSVARTRFRMENSLILEDLLSSIFFNARVVTFTSLHLVHLGLIPLVASGEMPSFPIKKNGVHFILDKSVHASIQINRGLMQQFGPISLVNFSDTEDLKETFKIVHYNNYTPIAFSDGIGSMGSMAPVKNLISFCESYDGYLYIDDAHGTSVFGKHGEGYVLEQMGIPFYPRLILTASLSKAFGTHGAAVVVPTIEDEDIIRHYCNTYLFSNPIPFPIINASIVSAQIHLSDELVALQNKFRKNASVFDTLLRDKFSIKNLDTDSPIRCIHVGEEFKAINMALKLRERGFAVTAAMYPTTPKGESIIRVGLCANHTLENIQNLCSAFKKFG